MSIAGLFAKICLILHTLTLIFTVFSKAEKTFNINYTWLESNNLQITSDLQQYIVGWYWGATILSTVGFGDITPASKTILIQITIKGDLYLLSKSLVAYASDFLSIISGL